MIYICEDIIKGRANIKSIVAEVTPGGGKTGLGILAASMLIEYGVAERIGVVVPRNALKYQFERDFLNPFWGSGLKVRAAMNEPDPCRGTDGFIITYQSLSFGNDHLLADMQKYRYLLFFDEFHHVAEESSWDASINVLVNSASICIFATGTPYRKIGRISQLPYISGKETVITYNRKTAIQEKAIVPIEFFCADGSGKYVKNGKEKHFDTLENRPDLMACLHSLDYVSTLISKTIEHFSLFRASFPEAQCLVVGRSVEETERHAQTVNAMGFQCFSVSAEDSESLEKIKKFKQGAFPVLAGTGIPYEGLDVPNVSHIVSLTHIRSSSWLTQMTARAVRITPWKKCAYVFSPSDPDFMAFKHILETEQLPEAQGMKQQHKERKDKSEIQNRSLSDYEYLNVRMSGIQHLSGIRENDMATQSDQELQIREKINREINSRIQNKGISNESMRRRKVLWRRIYLSIGRKCRLKEMTLEEMKTALTCLQEMGHSRGV